jgi:hypothetical protein
MAIDEGKLNEFLGRFVTDLGATAAAGNIVIGHKLGLFRALAEGRPRPANSPPGQKPTSATSPNGCAGRRRADTSNMTQRPTPTR